jgi:hypothetical protein
MFNYYVIVQDEQRREKIPQGCGLIRLNRKTIKEKNNEIDVRVYQGRMEKT